MSLVDQFKEFLDEAGVEVRTSSQGKYFRATKDGIALVILAHESTKVGWWGILKSHVDELEKDAEKPEYNLNGWGAVLLHKGPRMGYWIKGENVLELIRLGLVSLSGQGQYLFADKVLEKKSGLASYFFSVKGFLKLSGLPE